MEKNLTSGSVFKNVVCFSLPFLLSYFLQTLYGMADLFIIGQFGGVEQTTAVSIGSQVMHMITVMIVGLSMGSTVIIARAVGAEDKKSASRTVGNTATLFMLISVALALTLLLFEPVHAKEFRFALLHKKFLKLKLHFEFEISQNHRSLSCVLTLRFLC